VIDLLEEPRGQAAQKPARQADEEYVEPQLPLRYVPEKF